MFLKIRKSGGAVSSPSSSSSKYETVLRYSTSNNSNANRTLPTLPSTASTVLHRRLNWHLQRKQNQQEVAGGAAVISGGGGYKQEIRPSPLQPQQPPPLPPYPSGLVASGAVASRRVRLSSDRPLSSSAVRNSIPHHHRRRLPEESLTSDSDNDFRPGHVANNEAAIQRLYRRRAYVPDLVLNCPVNGQNIDSSEHEPDNDYYEEIEELLPKLNLLSIHHRISSARNDITPPPRPPPKRLLVRPPTATTEVMGQSLSLRKPRISMTWVLREQQQQQQQANNSPNHQQNSHLSPAHHLCQSSPNLASFSDHLSSPTIPFSASSIQIRSKKPRNFRNSLTTNSVTSAKTPINNEGRLFSEKAPVTKNNKKIPNRTDCAKPVNGFTKLQSTKSNNCDVILPDNNNNNHFVHNNNNNSVLINNLVSKPKDGGGSSVDNKNVNNFLNDYNNNIHNATQKLPPKYNYQQQQHQKHLLHEQSISVNGSELKNPNYSEPSLCALSEGGGGSGGLRRQRHKKRRERKSGHHHHHHQHFGYDIKNVDEFLSQCSLISPGNIPVVVSNSSTLYQTKPGGYQVEIPVPLGMVVNAVFKNQSWLYVQTPHAEEGYISYNSCLPLGILPPNRPDSANERCWESKFPKPSGNMTDSEKEVHLRGTKSEGARTPRSRRAKSCGEKQVDTLYLKATSQPKLDKMSSQSKSSRHKTSPIDEYVTLQRNHNPTSSQPPSRQRHSSSSTSTGRQHFPKNHKLSSSSSCSSSLVRQTLLAVQEDYASNAIAVQKGDVVTLLACKEYREKNKEMRQWFYVKTRNGTSGFIPAEVAGHGYL